MRSKYSKLLNSYTLVLAFCTLLLIVAGGLVTSTDSGLSVPDWPLSYGKLMPPMVGGILYEHGHRMVASLVGLLTVILVFLIYRKDQRSWLRKLSIVALIAVILQGVLGGMTVLFLLPTWISVSHATLAQTFFCIVSLIALFQTPWWQKGELPLLEENRGKSLFTFGVIAVGVVYVQLIVGALMRHTASGLAVPDFPLAYGQILPSLSPQALAQYNNELILRDLRLAADGPITRDQIIIHMIHRIWAVVTGVTMLIYAFRIYRQSRYVKALRIPAVVMAILIPLQITLGAFTVLTHKSVDITTIHVATGALILVTSVIATLMIYRVSSHPAKEHRPAFHLKEVAA
jgi:cytochrome c oxidase assembly protein subunit 15